MDKTCLLTWIKLGVWQQKHIHHKFDNNNLTNFKEEKTIEKLKKKLNYLKETKFILTELQPKYDILEKKVDCNSFKINEKVKVPVDTPNKNEEVSPKLNLESASTSVVIKCEKFEFTTNSESDLRIHPEDNHKRKKNIKCWKCHFTTKVKGDLTTHNDK